jgi:hypothetical protein
MENITSTEKHKELCNYLNDLYIRKNNAYGDSFHELYKDLGIISAVTQITHKYNRLKTLAKDHTIDINDESIIDTLLDMANYCIMTVVEVTQENK